MTLSLDDLKEGNARRDAGFMSLFEECLDRMLEAQVSFIHYNQPGDQHNKPEAEKALERRNRHRKAILDAIRGQLEGNSNIQLKYFELAALVPQPMVIQTSCPHCGKSIIGEPGK